MPTIPRKISCSTSPPMNHPQACCCASLTSAPIHITNMTIPQATSTNEAIVTPGWGLPAGAPRAIKPVAIPTSTANTHAPMYHRVVIRLLIACLLAPPSPYLGNDSRHGVTYEIESNWQGRKDSNRRPSALEFPASSLPAPTGATANWNLRPSSTEVGRLLYTFGSTSAHV